MQEGPRNRHEVDAGWSNLYLLSVRLILLAHRLGRGYRAERAGVNDGGDVGDAAPRPPARIAQHHLARLRVIGNLPSPPPRKPRQWNSTSGRFRPLA